MAEHHKTDEEFDTEVTAVIDGTDPILHPGQGITPAERDILLSPKSDWDAKFLVGGLAHKSTRSPEQITEKTHARFLLEPLYNHFVKILVKNNSLIDDFKKILWKIHIDSTVRHIIGAGPASFPSAVKKDLNTPLHVKLSSVANTTPTLAALPGDVDRCDAFVYIFADSTTPEPTSEGQFIKAAETTDDKMDIAFDLANKGKRVKIILQYFNPKGHGPSSEIIDTIIP